MKIKVSYISAGIYLTDIVEAKDNKTAEKIIKEKIIFKKFVQMKQEQKRQNQEFEDFKKECINISCNVFQVDDIYNGRKKQVAFARMLTWILIKNRYPQTTQAQLGAMFNKDHATARYGMLNMIRWLRCDKEIIADVSLLLDVAKINEDIKSWKK